MTLLLGALTIGLILSLLALGVYISYRVFDIADITVDGSITLGGAICAVQIVNGTHPLVATLAGFLGGLGAGTVTGVLQTRFKVNPLLSGILVMTGLYSVNLHVMGKSNVALMAGKTFMTGAERLGRAWFGKPDVNLLGWLVGTRDLVTLGVVLGLTLLACIVRSAAKPQPKERGCVVLDQPQHVGSAGTLRLVSDTAALRKIVAARDDLGGY